MDRNEKVGGLKSVRAIRNDYWHHIMVSRNADTLALYVDGVLDCEYNLLLTYTSSSSNSAYSYAHLEIGSIPSEEAVSNVLKSISHVEFRGYLSGTRIRTTTTGQQLFNSYEMTKSSKSMPDPPLCSPDVLGLEVFELLLRLYDKDPNMITRDERLLQCALRIFRRSLCSMQYRVIAFLSCVLPKIDPSVMDRLNAAHLIVPHAMEENEMTKGSDGSSFLNALLLVIGSSVWHVPSSRRHLPAEWTSSLCQHLVLLLRRLSSISPWDERIDRCLSRCLKAVIKNTEHKEHLLRATGVMCVLVQDINSLEYQTFVRYRHGDLSDAAKRRGILEENEMPSYWTNAVTRPLVPLLSNSIVMRQRPDVSSDSCEDLLSWIRHVVFLSSSCSSSSSCESKKGEDDDKKKNEKTEENSLRKAHMELLRCQTLKLVRHLLRDRGWTEKLTQEQDFVSYLLRLAVTKLPPSRTETLPNLRRFVSSERERVLNVLYLKKNDEMEGDEKEEIKTDGISCSQCTLVSANKIKLLRHVLRDHQDSVPAKTCPICNQSIPDLWTHVESKHLARWIDTDDVITASTSFSLKDDDDDNAAAPAASAITINTTTSTTTKPRNLVRELEDMGFPLDWCRLAVQESPSDIVQASTWIVDHLDVLTKESSEDESNSNCLMTEDSDNDDENDIFDLGTYV